MTRWSRARSSSVIPVKRTPMASDSSRTQAMTPWIFLSGHLLAAAGVVVALMYFHGRLIRQFPEAGE